jgi:hypothetical protein
MVNTGLASVAAAYASPPPPWAAAFINTTSNWNMVVNGGTVLGCLAVAGTRGRSGEGKGSWTLRQGAAHPAPPVSTPPFLPPPLASGEQGVPAWVTASLLPSALATMQQSIAGFAPDGGWQEGPNYAGYGTRYFVPVSFSLLRCVSSRQRARPSSQSSCIHRLALLPRTQRLGPRLQPPGISRS